MSIAKALLRVGGGSLSRLINRDLLLIFGYHRVRPAGSLETPFDEGVFGPSPQELHRHIELLKKFTTVLGEADLIAAVRGDPLPGNGPYSMITFDDAYVDNFELALPVLQELSVPATFFVPAHLIENRQLGWWDQIAFVVKNCKMPSIQFRGETIDLAGRRQDAIRGFFNMMKLMPHTQTSSLIEELSEAAESPAPTTDLMDRELMSWDQLAQAHKSGITLGSHTCTHRVLATLSDSEQAEEISESRRFIENRLGIQVKSIAFPVGGVRQFNRRTVELSEEAGYDLAFSFNTGAARAGAFDRYAIPRLAPPTPTDEFNALLHFPRLMDYRTTPWPGSLLRESP
ncbi:MAG: polysaccharide deacetylase family protein [Xanthomonadales bacterium]|nr:polysaccharide deacetylase family protein [Xanthomonadales bacterium]